MNSVNRNVALRHGASALAVAAAMGMGSTALAQPAQNQLPTGGVVATGDSVGVYDADTNTLTITSGEASAIRWANTGGTIVADKDFAGVVGRGFNIGEGATVNFKGVSAVLNVDRTGNPSQIFGTLDAEGALFVANENGVIVGSSGDISAGGAGAIAILGFRQDADKFGGDVLVNESTVTAGGAITVEKGANLSGNGLLIAGGGAVNVNSVAVDGGLIGAGFGVVDSTTLGDGIDDLTGSISVSGGEATIAELASTGDITAAVVGGTGLTVTDIEWGGTLSNSGVLEFGGNVAAVDSNNLSNTGTVTGGDKLFLGGSLVNVGKIGDIGEITAVGSIENKGQINGADFVRAGHDGDHVAVDDDGDPIISSLTNAGSIRNVADDVEVTASGSLTNNGVIRSDKGAVTVQAGVDAGTSDIVDDNATLMSGGILDVGVDGDLSVVAGGNISLGALRADGKAGAATNRLGDVVITSENGNITTNGAAWVDGFDAEANEGSIFVNAPVNADDDITMDASSQIFLRSSLVAAKDISLTTTGEGSGPFDLGIVQFNEGDVIESDAGDVTLDAGDAMEGGSSVLLYGDVVSGNNDVVIRASNLYAGTETTISTERLVANYSGVITGGIAKGSGTQVGDAFDRGVNIVSPDGDDVDVELNPTDLVASRQNTNLLVTGLDEGSSANVEVDLGGITPIFDGDSVVINEDAVRSNLFVRSDADLNLTNGGADFYWPGRIYASTIEPGTLGTVGSGELSFGNAAGGVVSNVLPRVTSEGGAGMFLISNDIEEIDSLVVNANSFVNLANDDIAGAFRAENTANDDFAFTAGEPVGTTLTFDEELPNSSIQSFTAPER